MDSRAKKTNLKQKAANKRKNKLDCIRNLNEKLAHKFWKMSKKQLNYLN